MDTPSTDSLFLTSAQVLTRYGGTSQSWLKRRIARDGFPAPIRFGGRYRHFKLSEIEAWEAAKKACGAKVVPLVCAAK